MTTGAKRALLAGSVLLLALIGVVAATWFRDRPVPKDLPPVAEVDSRPVPIEPAEHPWSRTGEHDDAALFYDRFETIGTEDGLPSERVTCVVAEDGDLWVGTEHGLAIRRDGEWTTYGTEDGLAHRYVTALARDERNGDLWISTLGGLSHLSAGAFRNHTQINSGLMNDVIYHVVLDGDLVWAATAAGTSILDTRTGNWALYDHENSIMHEPWCYAIALGPGRAWIGVWGGGIVELDRRTQRWRAYRDPDGEMEIDLIPDDGPIHDVTSFIAYDDGYLWQATYFGLARYDGRRWRSYMARDTGLPGDFIHHVDARGRTCFIGSDQGFGVFDGETCVSYERREDGSCDLTVWRNGEVVERRTLATAPAHDYVLWVQGGEDEVWLATAAGLSHGIAGPRRE
ncbi:MAG: ligand-binding sensor domain-containing protein [Planctomycetota bacterium]|jgi:ligand-binding sensor domain-containing protein